VEFNQLLDIGTVADLRERRDWLRILDFSQVDFHSHPCDEKDARYPSFQDMRYLTTRNGLTIVGSRDRLCEVPELADDVNLDQLWKEYVLNTRGFDASSHAKHGDTLVASEFMEEVVAPCFVEWDTIPPQMWLGDISSIHQE
jgi:hypothetical protein